MDKRAIVSSGMELLRFSYDPETWQDMRRRRLAYLRRRDLVRDDTPVGDFPEAPPADVVFTATGLLKGRQAWPWRTHWWELNEPYLMGGGCQSLLITFIHRLGIFGRKIAIPLPAVVVDDVVGLVQQHLTPKTLGQKPLQVIPPDDCDLDLFDAEASPDPLAHQTRWHPIKAGGSRFATHTWRCTGGRCVLKPNGWLGEQIVFDTTTQTVSRGRIGVRPVLDVAQIHALQLISEALNDNRAQFVSWELNLVLANAERVNVVDFGGWREIVDLAQELSALLNVPLWKSV